MLWITKSRTTPYHPESDGKTENFNKTLLSMLRTLSPAEKLNWKDHVAPLVHAYNCCRHCSTGFSPFYLMFGRCPRLPVDIFLGIPEEDGLHSTVSSIRQNLEAAYKIASDAANVSRLRQAKGYNKKVRGSPIETGDFVLVKNVNIRGKHKLADKWCTDLYIVIAQPNEAIPVFVVWTENGTAEKVLHRNMLLPLILPWPDERSVDNDVLDVSHVDDDSDGEESMFEVHIAYDDVVDVDDIVEEVEDVDDVVVDENVQTDDVEVDDNAFDVVAVGEAVSPEAPPQPAVDAFDQSPSGSPPPPCRSARATRGQPPVRLGDYVCHGQTVDVVLLDWQVKVAALMQLLPIFPLYHGQILHAILYIISHA